VIVVEHDLSVIEASDWLIDMGPGAGDEGGHIVVAGTPVEVARSRASRTAPYLAKRR
jgi:excinuclease ABC subunit A